MPLVALYRPRLRHVVFIGVTGSCGKTTTKELIAGVLGSQFKGKKTPDTDNQPWHIALTVLRVWPRDHFCVHEIGVGKRAQPGIFEKTLELIRPQIGVVTNIGTDHISAFGTIEAIAAQKGRLIEALPARGTAVLNADDQRVLAMQATCKARVMTYGLAPEAMVRAENVRSRWPERLSFTVRFEGQTEVVHTRLCGEHWVSAALATIAVALAMGMSLAKAARALEGVPPFERRMRPETHDDGVTFVCDDIKSPLWSIPAALDFMRQASAPRKIVVIGTISDYTGNSDRTFMSVAKQALAVADRVIFVGPRASKSLKARRHPEDEALQAFSSVAAAREHLSDVLRSGDLVLLKGTGGDGFDKLLSARAGPSGGVGGRTKSDRSRETPARGIAPARVLAIVGLGNPGPQFRHSPHNVGQAVLDHLAVLLHAEWTEDNEAFVARVEQEGTAVYLIKPLTNVNTTGPTLLRMSQQLRFVPADCVLVHDDLDLPLGTVRARMNGSDGGHNGVRSVLEVFQSTGFRRVKIGVGRPELHGRTDQHVLASFSPELQMTMEKACDEAARRVLSLLGIAPRAVR
jgi:aminoacyl-tRNA hydrolase